ncbi:MAG: hypothetical protein ACOX0M_00895 [Salinivirgaceae bacterium]
MFEENRTVVLFNGFQKKIEKLPTQEINKALIIKKDYYDDNKSNINRLRPHFR